uniref:Uncharacterized protein n=1 Tax=Glossina brevipalpis TaxID=37001 RepID=A0A1A9WXL9_9MUSC
MFPSLSRLLLQSCNIQKDLYQNQDPGFITQKLENIPESSKLTGDPSSNPTITKNFSCMYALVMLFLGYVMPGARLCVCYSFAVLCYSERLHMSSCFNILSSVK